DFAGDDPVGECVHERAHDFRVRAHFTAPIDADERGAFQECEVQWQFRYLAIGKADDQMTTTGGEATEGGFGISATDRIVNDIDAALFNERVERLAPVGV